MKKAFILILLCLGFSPRGLAQKVDYSVNPSTGAISKIWIEGERSEMNWLLATDGSQYHWADEKYGWGLGYLDLSENGVKSHFEWKVPYKISNNGSKVEYEVGGVKIDVLRRRIGNDLLEKYIFTNSREFEIQLDSIGIYTPFNDNYPDARTCLDGRAHAHIWAGENASYVNLCHMSGTAPHIGLVLMKGNIRGYEIWERDINTSSSNARGIIALSPQGQKLAPGQSFSIEWKLFSNNGWDDFFNKLVSAGDVRVQLDKYVFESGEKAVLEIVGPEKKLKNCAVFVGEEKYIATGTNGKRQVEITLDSIGEKRIDVTYGNGEHTHADCLVLSSHENILRKRVDFILNHQQMNDPADPRFGAYMVYDNDLERIYLNDTPNSSPADRCEGAERLGMGVLLAKYCLLHPNEAIEASLVRYADFVRRGLQDWEYNTWRSMSHAWGNRHYNYPWISDFYFLMYKLTGNKRYALDGYGTLKALYRSFGHSHYTVGPSLTLSLECLEDAGLVSERKSRLDDFMRVGLSHLETSINFPKQEVNYEEGRAANSVIYMLEMYLLTQEKRFLDEAEKQMPLLESFGGLQPSYYLNEIAIRHWDGYWFGKNEMWGDTMPHYWSCLTAKAYHLYALCTGKQDYQRRAEKIVTNNLCLFTEDGHGSCAYIYPDRVNGVKGKYYDPFANDQDWALVYYLEIYE